MPAVIPAILKAQAVKAANEVRKTLTGSFSEVQALVDDHELVFAVWKDRTESDGVGLMLIKGQQCLREICASGLTKGLAMTAIPCVCVEQAEALRQVAGERDHHH